MSSLSSGGRDSSSGPFSILVVEDDRSTRALLLHLLSASGYRVRSADSIAAAREELRAAVDLVILDRMLPDGDGVELAREIRNNTLALGPYVLMLSSISTDAAKLEGFDSGADDYVTKPFGQEELLARVRAGLRIVDLQRALIAGNRRLERISTTDAVTGVRNRRWFDEEVERAFAQAVRYQRPLSVAIIDIDHFKQVNDSYGHLAGDAVLRTVSDRIAQTLRKADSLARIGGEEFAVILPETALFEGLQAGEKIRSSVRGEAFDTGAATIALSVSIGVASLPHSRFTHVAQLLAFADQALYRAKNRGRDRVELERRSDPSRSNVGAEDRRSERSVAAGSAT